MTDATPSKLPKAPLLFVALVFAFSAPVWLLGEAVEHFLPQERLINLPFSALMMVNPLIVALILTYRETGAAGATALLARTFDAARIAQKLWLVPAFLVMPAVIVAAYVWMRLAGVALPDPQLPLLIVPVFFVMFFFAGALEELGWQGYAFDPLQERWGALPAALFIGTVWAAWHIVPFAQAHRGETWIFWQCAGTVAARILIVWIYVNAGRSVFAAIVFHAMSNVSEFLFPNYGSHYDPFYAAIVLG
ncbi:MAG: CPBP family intramembrane metalloprotease, partial [Alphaproteobacteria bacterium]|nr:CPBP family intramembrane metalloprotease [Alphaproteobacteria bacterium]